MRFSGGESFLTAFCCCVVQDDVENESPIHGGEISRPCQERSSSIDVVVVEVSSKV